MNKPAEKKEKIRFVEDRVVRDHNGDVIDHFKTGQVKEMGASSARHWLNRGVAVEAGARAKDLAPRPSKPERPEGDDLMSDIVSKIDTLDAEGEDYTAAGIPSVPALEKALAYNITAAERNAAWDIYQSQKQGDPAGDDAG